MLWTVREEGEHLYISVLGASLLQGGIQLYKEGCGDRHLARRSVDLEMSQGTLSLPVSR